MKSTPSHLEGGRLGPDEGAAQRVALLQPQDRAAISTRQVEPYLSRFGNWDRRASVRVKPARALEATHADPAAYFPPELAPESQHSLTVALGPDAVRFVLVQRLLGYLDFTADLEAALVIPVVSDLARGKSGVELERQMRIDAYKILTDEAYHAQFSDDLGRQVQAQAGVRKLDCELAFLAELDALSEVLPNSLRPVAPLVYAICSETLISGILSSLPQDERLLPVVRQVVRDHAEDEGRHNAYFRDVLTRFWSTLSSGERRQVGQLLPRAITILLQPDHRRVFETLIKAGLSPEDARTVVLESYPDDAVRQSCRQGATSTVNYLRAVGAFEDAYVRESFESFSLLPSEPVSQG